MSDEEDIQEENVSVKYTLKGDTLGGGLSAMTEKSRNKCLRAVADGRSASQKVGNLSTTLTD